MTIEEHLKTLPEPYRSQALHNMWWERKDDQVKTVSRALGSAFTWYKSPEGISYWSKFAEELLKKENKL